MCSRQDTNNSPKSGERNLCMNFLVVKNLDESDRLILGRNFVRNFDVTTDLNNAIDQDSKPGNEVRNLTGNFDNGE